MVRSCGGQRTAAVALELAAEAGAEDDGAGEGDHAADGVHHRRAGEVVERQPSVMLLIQCGIVLPSQPPGPQTQWPKIG